MQKWSSSPDQFQGLSFSSENFNRFDKKNSSHDLFKFQRAKLFDPDQRTPDKFGDFLLLATIYKAFGINNNVCMYLVPKYIRVVLNQELNSKICDTYTCLQKTTLKNIIKW